MHHEGAAMTERPQSIVDMVVDGRSVPPALEGYCQQTGRLVHHHQRIVFVENLNITGVDRAMAAPRAARPIHPETNHIALTQAGSCIDATSFGAVDENLSALERLNDALARAQSFRCRQEFVESESGGIGRNGP
jgi:hypothetical protein